MTTPDCEPTTPDCEPTTPDHEPTADTASINKQIATLLGWTDLRLSANASPSVWRGKPPGRYRYYDVPDYCGDYGEALELLETCLSNPMIAAMTILQTHNGLWCSRVTIRLSFDGISWHELKVDGADTLPLAIAKACRDALNAIRGDTDDGTN